MICPPIILPAFPTSFLGACPNIIGKYIMTLLNIKKNYWESQKYAPTKCKNFSLILLISVISVKLSDIIPDQLGQQVTCSKVSCKTRKTKKSSNMLILFRTHSLFLCLESAGQIAFSAEHTSEIANKLSIICCQKIYCCRLITVRSNQEYEYIKRSCHQETFFKIRLPSFLQID